VVSHHRRPLVSFLTVVLVAGVLPGIAPAAVSAVSPTVVLSQVYGGGGNSGATLTNDFIEVFNRGNVPVDLTGMSVQYGAAAGQIGQTASFVTSLSGTLAPGQYLLVQEAAGASGTTPLPTPDASGTIAMGATAGKVALVSDSTPLNCGATLTPCDSAKLAMIIDLVGYGSTANTFEGAGPTPAPSNTAAVLRGDHGCTDRDNNSTDFTAGAPNPRNRLSPTAECAAESAPQVTSTSPGNGATGVAVNANLSITFSEPVDVAGSWFSISCPASGAHTAAPSGGPTTLSLDPDADFALGETCMATVIAAQVTDQDLEDPPDSMAANFVWSFTTVPLPVAIHDIQGAAQLSPLNGRTVTTQGVLTALRTNGFYLQDPNPDSSDATSEAIFVFTSSAPVNGIGDALSITALVTEFRAGGATSTNLTTTELTAPGILTQSTGNPLPAPVVVGTGGRTPPDTVIEDDATGEVETSGVFDPQTDGIDFYESLEAMRVQVNDAVAVGPRANFGANREVPVVGDNGANAALRTARGGIVVRPTDFNPERIILNDLLVGGPTLPTTNVGDTFPGATIGVFDYSFGNFKLEVATLPARVDNGLSQEAATAAGLNEISIGTFNVENLAPGDPTAKYATLADLIVDNLKAPDILSIEEIQDNNGTTNDGTVDASVTWGLLIDAIETVGGPTYEYRQIDPVNNQDGGAPGGNIRVGFLFRADRGLSFIDRPGAGSTTPNAVIGSGASTQLQYSPGRIDPTNTAFNASRKPLAAEFSFNGHHLFVVANHFNSKGGDEPLFGHGQPPDRISEVQRHQQAAIVHDFVADILAADPDANVAVVGDLNDFEFSDTISILKGSTPILHDLIETLPANERYTYVFEGNSQTLDHILVSGPIFSSRPFTMDSVHANAEFANQASDHEPQVVRILLNDPPTVSAGGPYALVEGGSVGVTATASDLEGGPLTYAWDLDNNGTYETPGQSATFSAGSLVAPVVATIGVQVTDDGGLTDTATTTVQIQFPFDGFFAPVDNLPTFNVVKAGQLVPVKFSLSGDRGLDIFAAGSPTSVVVPCPTSASVDLVQEVAAAAASTLVYDPVTDRYIFTWRTQKAWADTCRQLVITLTDGTQHRANFMFRR
jgi:predicted extracellular nuclease